MSQAQTNGNSLMLQGRIVWTSGKLFEGAPRKDERTKQVVLDQLGNPTITYGFGLAVPKVDPRTGQFTAEWTKLYQALQSEALTLFPGGNIPQGFAMKYKDGDTDVDPSGTPYNKRDGYAGHVVLACTTQIPIKYFRWEGGNNILVNDGFKCGDYVNVQINIKAHPAVGQGKAGLYVNPSAVQLIQAGKEIINTPSGDQMFGMTAPTYSGEIIPHAGPQMPGIGAFQPQQQQAPMPSYNAQPAYAPQAPVAAPAHYGVVPGAFQPQQQQAPMGMPQTGNAPSVQGVGQYPGQNQVGLPPVANAYPSNPGTPPMPGMPR